MDSLEVACDTPQIHSNRSVSWMATYLSLMAYPGKVYKFYAHIIDIDIAVVEETHTDL